MRVAVAVSLVSLALSACTPQDAAKKAEAPNASEQQLFTLADGYRQSGNLQEAARVYQQMIDMPNATSAPYLALASAYRSINQPGKAAGVLRDARQKFPQDVRVTNELGFAQIADNQLEAALATFERALATDAKNVSAYNGKGAALDAMGKNEEAQNSYREGLKLDPDNLALTNNYALSLLLSDHYDEAIQLLAPLSDGTEASPTVRQNLALAYGLKGDSARAAELGMRDLSLEQVKKNQEFYAHYLRAKRANGPTSQAAPVSPVAASEPTLERLETVYTAKQDALEAAHPLELAPELPQKKMMTPDHSMEAPIDAVAVEEEATVAEPVADAAEERAVEEETANEAQTPPEDETYMEPVNEMSSAPEQEAEPVELEPSAGGDPLTDFPEEGRVIE